MIAVARPAPEPQLADQLFALADTFTALAAGRLVLTPADAETQSRLVREGAIFARRMQITLDELTAEQQEQDLLDRFQQVRAEQIRSGGVVDLATARMFRR